MKELDTGISIVRRIGNSERVGAYYVSLALLRNHLGYRQPALSACEQVSLLLEEKNATVWPTVARRIRGDIALELGDVSDALAQFEMAFDLAAKRKDWDRARSTYGRIQNVIRGAENRKKVEDAVGNRKSRLAENANVKGQGMVALWKAEMQLAKGQTGPGLASLSEGVESFRKAGCRAWGSAAAIRRASVLEGMGKDAPAEAVEATREALELTLAAEDYASAINLELQLGALLERDWTRNNIQEAVIRYREAYKLAREQKLEALEVESLNYLGLAFRNRKDQDLALACILQAQERLAEMPSNSSLEAKVAGTLEKIRETFPSQRAFEQQKESVVARKVFLLGQATQL
jgi:tetratricopeptide (TPR) repeat protein